MTRYGIWVVDSNYLTLITTKSYFTTDGMSACLSWCQAPSGAQGQFFVTVRQLRVFLFGEPSLTRERVCRPSPAQSLSVPSPEGLPQSRGPGPRIYVPQEQSGPVIPPGTEFSLHRLLQLAVLWWKYSNPPPHGLMWTLETTPCYTDSSRTT
jgi:hypothetical protein